LCGGVVVHGRSENESGGLEEGEGDE
jgi:hypothetical protein